jgi:hypothetical protein
MSFWKFCCQNEFSIMGRYFSKSILKSLTGEIQIKWSFFVLTPEVVLARKKTISDRLEEKKVFHLFLFRTDSVKLVQVSPAKRKAKRKKREKFTFFHSFCFVWLFGTFFLLSRFYSSGFGQCPRHTFEQKLLTSRNDPWANKGLWSSFAGDLKEKCQEVVLLQIWS